MSEIIQIRLSRDEHTRLALFSPLGKQRESQTMGRNDRRTAQLSGGHGHRAADDQSRTRGRHRIHQTV